MAKELSPKQKQIAKVAGNPNKIEGKDFQALKSMKKGSSVKGKTQKQLPRKKGMYSLKELKFKPPVGGFFFILVLVRTMRVLLFYLLI